MCRQPLQQSCNGQRRPKDRSNAPPIFRDAIHMSARSLKPGPKPEPPQSRLPAHRQANMVRTEHSLPTPDAEAQPASGGPMAQADTLGRAPAQPGTPAPAFRPRETVSRTSGTGLRDAIPDHAPCMTSNWSLQPHADAHDRPQEGSEGARMEHLAANLRLTQHRCAPAGAKIAKVWKGSPTNSTPGHGRSQALALPGMTASTMQPVMAEMALCHSRARRE